jgi:hypothetical protein
MISLSWGHTIILSNAGPVMLYTASFVERESQQPLLEGITALENVLEEICIAPWYPSNRTFLINQLDMHEIMSRTKNCDL